MFSQFRLFSSGNSSTISSGISKKPFNWLPGPRLFVMRFGSRLTNGTTPLVYESSVPCGWKMYLSLLSFSTSSIRINEHICLWEERSWNRLPPTSLQKSCYTGESFCSVLWYGILPNSFTSLLLKFLHIDFSFLPMSFRERTIFVLLPTHILHNDVNLDHVFQAIEYCSVL